MMNALKFLAVDRSLDSKADVVGRFQVREKGMLPVLNPGSRAGKPAKPMASGDRASLRHSIWRRFVGWAVRADTEAAAPKSTATEQQPELRSFQKPSAEVPAGVAQQHGITSDGKSPFSRLAGYNPFNRTEKKDVQIEFRFENVRVICNEMHDTDFIIRT